jgi:hypothetical protein
MAYPGTYSAACRHSKYDVDVVCVCNAAVGTGGWLGLVPCLFKALRTWLSPIVRSPEWTAPLSLSVVTTGMPLWMATSSYGWVKTRSPLGVTRMAWMARMAINPLETLLQTTCVMNGECMRSRRRVISKPFLLYPTSRATFSSTVRSHTLATTAATDCTCMY